MILDSAVTRVNADGSLTMTNVVNPGDTILHTTYAELAARFTVPANQAQGWIRTDVTDGQIDAHGGYTDPLMTKFKSDEELQEEAHSKSLILPEEGTVPLEMPPAEAPKRDWWTYAVAKGYDEEEYERVSKASLMSWSRANA